MLYYYHHYWTTFDRRFETDFVFGSNVEDYPSKEHQPRKQVFYGEGLCEHDERDHGREDFAKGRHSDTYQRPLCLKQKHKTQTIFFEEKRSCTNYFLKAPITNKSNVLKQFIKHVRATEAQFKFWF